MVGAPKAALDTLAHHLGGLQHVPVAWGGRCPLSFEDYASHRALLELVHKLNAGQQQQQQ